jgi:hypothetical protein
MVLDLKAPAEHAALGAALSQVVASEAAQVVGYQILTVRDLQAAVAQETQRQLLGCDDDNGCLAELADAADAELLVHGTLGATGAGTPLVALTLLNTRALVVLNRVAFGWAGDPAELPAVVATATQTLVLEARDRPPGAVAVVGVPDDALVFVDDVDRTDAHRRGAIGGLDIGPHAVRVVAEGLLPAVVPVVVRRGQTTTISPALQPEPPDDLVLWGGAVAMAALGVGVTAGVLWLLAPAEVQANARVPAYGLDDVETLRSAR